jgi:hypothetical protein
MMPAPMKLSAAVVTRGRRRLRRGIQQRRLAHPGLPPQQQRGAVHRGPAEERPDQLKLPATSGQRLGNDAQHSRRLCQAIVAVIGHQKAPDLTESQALVLVSAR